MKLGLICRCRGEYFIEELVNYYINESIDFLYIIDDDSNDKSIYDDIIANRKVKVILKKI